MTKDLGTLAGRTFDAVIFDMDETLIASGEATRRSWMTWASEYGITAEQLAGAQGQPSAQIVQALLSAELVDEASARIEELECADYYDVVPLPGALRALSELPLDKVAIATSCTAALLAVRHTQAGLATPGAMVNRDMVEAGKPAPDTFLKAAEMLGVDPARALVVEDSPAGIAGAKAAGAASLAVITTTAVDDLHADGIVSNLDDIDWIVTDEGIRITLR